MQQQKEKISCHISPLAYRKIMYHCLRYPSSKVSGVLVGSSTKITDAYPLFHTSIVNPTFNVALDLISSNLDEGVAIVGFYEIVEGGMPKINHIIENNAQFKQMIAIRVWMDDDELNIGSSTHDFNHIPYEEVKKELKNGEYRFLVDFDAHFEQIELDFRNKFVKND